MRDMEYIVIFNHDSAVEYKNGVANRITDITMLDELKLHSNMLPDAMYKKMGYAISIEAIEKVLDWECYKLKLQSPNGPIKFSYYKKSTGLLRMAKSPSGETVLYPEYKKYIEGAVIPEIALQLLPTGDTLKLTRRYMYINEIIDTNIFNLQP